MDRGAWRATVHRVTKSWTRLKHLSTHTRPKTCEINRRVNTCHSGLTRINIQCPLYSFLPLPSTNFYTLFLHGWWWYICLHLNVQIWAAPSWQMETTVLPHFDRWKHLCNPCPCTIPHILPPQILGAPPGSISGHPHSLGSNTYSELILLQISFASSGVTQKWNHPEGTLVQGLFHSA